MRVLFKIILFPITLVLSLVVAICRFVCCFSGGVLSIISSIMVFITVVAWIIPSVRTSLMPTIHVLVVAFLISPFGIPKFADWLIDRLDDLNFAIKSI